MIKVLHYLNQFFAGIGGEEKAGQEVLFMPSAVGVGACIENALKAHGVEYATLACGDNYFHEAEEKALRAIRAAIEQFHPDIFLAGPAFNAGRYGIACAKVCSWVRDNWRIPAITAHARRQPGHQRNRPPCFRHSNRRLGGVDARNLETLFAADRTGS